MDDKIIDVFGYISKEDTVTNVNHLVLPNTLVLEEVEPFKGYYGNGLPNQHEPNFIYLVIKGQHTAEEILRTTSKIKKYSPHQFNAVHSIISFHNEEYSCIRIRGLKSYEHIADIQSSYAYEKLVFAKRKTIKTKAVLRVKKLFTFNVLEEGIYTDVDDDKMGYFVIPEAINWKKFEVLTKNVKNNIPNKLFDAALGGYFTRNGVVDFVRLYQEQLNVERIKEIRNEYLRELKRMA